MTIADVLAKLAELEKSLAVSAGSAKAKAWGSHEEWRQAVNAARAYIIARMAEEDDGK